MKQTKHANMKEEIKYRLNKNNYYDLLDVDKNCSIDDIKKSYKKLALRFHPDKNSSQGTKQVFNRITNAYSKLSNQQTKAQYDQKQRAFNKKAQQPNKSNNQSNKYKDEFSYYNFKTFDKQFQERVRRQQQQKLKRQFSKRSEQMQRQFHRVFSKMFQASQSQNQNQNQNQRSKQQFYQKNQEKQNIQRMKKQYQQQRRAKQNKQKFQKQQIKKKQFILAFFVVLFVFIFGSQVMQFLVKKPLYSMHKTPYHQLQTRTANLSLPFFVNEKYFKNETSQQIKDKIQHIVNNRYLQNLKKQCMAVQKQRKDLQQKAFRQKIGKRRDQFLNKAKNVDQKPCDVLFQYAMLHEAVGNSQK